MKKIDGTWTAYPKNPSSDFWQLMVKIGKLKGNLSKLQDELMKVFDLSHTILGKEDEMEKKGFGAVFTKKYAKMYKGYVKEIIEDNKEVERWIAKVHKLMGAVN